MWGIKGTFLNSKVARRIFTLFVISALLPVFILSFFSIRQIHNLTTHNIERDLRQDAKSYGLSVYDRLLLLDEKLAVHAASLEDLSLEETRRNIFYGFTQINVVNSFDETYKNNSLLSGITESERISLLDGNSVLLTKKKNGLHAEIYLLQSIKSTGHFIMALVDGEALWGGMDTFDDSKGLCVYGQEGELLFCSQKQLDSNLQLIKSTWMESTTGNTRFSDGKQNLFVGYWSLFTKPKFMYPNFTIAITYDQNLALDPISSLRNIFITVSILTLIIIAFLSTIQIRRYLTPLEELMSGIKRIENNNFKKPVAVTTDDEFYQLAVAFNSMSTKISQQFEFLTTMSGIDQQILSNITIKKIIAIIIAQASSATQSDSVNIIMVNEHNRQLLDVYSKDVEHIHGMSVESHLDQDGFTQTLLNKKSVVYSIDDEHIPGYLASLKQNKLSCLVFVPVCHDDIVSAVLVFGFGNSEVNQQSHYRLRELGDRFAIAIAKSAWEKKLYLQAHYDPLTSLPNRQLLYDRLEHMIKRSARENLSFSVMYLDLDGFKTVNDSLGHSIGDKLLKLVSQRLIEALRDEDTIARLGGDEFVILLTTVNRQTDLFSIVTPVAKKVLTAISQSYLIDNQDIHISTCIGIASYPTDGRDLETLLKNADAAMYQAKYEGRNSIQFYSDKLGMLAKHKLIMETKLHDALKNNEFELYYQPKVDAVTNQILGAEALLRWVHPTEGIIFPEQFITLVEDTGMIKQLGRWTINEACRQNKKWQNEGLSEIKISVNLSPKQFQQDDLVELISTALSDANLDPVYLDLEIIESAAMRDTELTIEILKKLKELGLSISIDDYGTGYSTLFYIKQFSVDCLKIDKCFIDNLVLDSGDKAIVSSTITLAHELGLTVIAEGVENVEQLKWLKDKGCDQIQGYYFNRPLPAHAFTKLLKLEMSTVAKFQKVASD